MRSLSMSSKFELTNTFLTADYDIPYKYISMRYDAHLDMWPTVIHSR